MKYEVRCCCEAEKLLGWLELDGALQPGQRDLRFPPRLACTSTFTQQETVEIVEERPAIHLEAAKFYSNPLTEPYIALKSHGATLEQLRKLPGFTEVPGSR